MIAAEWYKVGRYFVAVPLKNGSTFFRAAVTGEESRGLAKATGQFNRWMTRRGRGPFTTAQVARLGQPKLLVVREPVERFASLWRSIEGVSRQGRSTSLTGAGGHGLMNATPEELIAYIEANPNANRHWKRQSDWLKGLASVWVCDYRDMGRLLGLETAQQWNRSDASITAELPVDRIRAHYELDLELWHWTLPNAMRSIDLEQWP